MTPFLLPLTAAALIVAVLTGALVRRDRRRTRTGGSASLPDLPSLPSLPSRPCPSGHD
ncbi:hypothetical protein ACH4UM_15895 [Streptomyces sp. NPDC020801]